jgi:hypothetical protein
MNHHALEFSLQSSDVVKEVV